MLAGAVLQPAISRADGGLLGCLRRDRCAPACCEPACCPPQKAEKQKKFYCEAPPRALTLPSVPALMLAQPAIPIETRQLQQQILDQRVRNDRELFIKELKASIEEARKVQQTAAQQSAPPADLGKKVEELEKSIHELQEALNGLHQGLDNFQPKKK
ncbi:MAG: hypothetical protein IT428_30240 [Planctomycetaceae bacterium]|nr:hypothetical protein [Planctomycetaceae bacterium]